MLNDDVPEDLRDTHKLEFEMRLLNQEDLFLFSRDIKNKNLEVNIKTFNDFFNSLRNIFISNIKEIYTKRADALISNYNNYFELLKNNNKERVYRLKITTAPYYMEEKETFEIYLEVYEKLPDRAKLDEENALKSEIKLLRKLLRKHKHVLKDEELKR